MLHNREEIKQTEKQAAKGSGLDMSAFADPLIIFTVE
jgi:hypothetical protein